MASRLDARLKRLEALQGDDVDWILDSLTYEQGRGLLALMMSVFQDVEKPSDERFKQVLASVPDGTFERLFAAFLKRVAWEEAA